MSDLHISNYCELFGFNENEEPVGRLPIKIGSKVFPQGYVYSSDVHVEGFNIAENIDNKALIYCDNPNYVILHMFVPEGTAKNVFVNSQPEKKLFRFGNIRYIKESFIKGKFLIRSALEYIRKEHDEARNDNGLIHSEIKGPDGVKITFAKTGQKIKPIGDTNLTSVLPVDSYILCFSYDYDETFYEKFSGANSCLVINDTGSFQERMHKAFYNKMPGHYGMNARVTYSRNESFFGVLFSKRKRFLYQREYRFVWQEHVPKRNLNIHAILNSDEKELKPLIPDPVEISIGSLEDIASIIKK